MIVHARTGRTVATQVEGMLSARERMRGLLKFDKPPHQYAAIFHLPVGGFFPLVHTLSMKFGIDIIFCDLNKRVVCIRRSVPPGRWIMPWKYFFGGCRFLVEFSECDTSMIDLGDELRWEALP